MNTGKIRIFIVLNVLASLAVFSCPVVADSNDAFLKEISSKLIVTNRRMAPLRRHLNLTKENKMNIRMARNTLQEFLISFSDRDDRPVKYLSLELQKKYKSRSDLFAKEFEARTLLHIKIFDFLVKPNGEILFYVVLTDTLEGIDRSYQTAFGLIKIKNNWNISRFSSDIEFRETEEREQ